MSRGVISGQVRIGIIGAGLIGQTHSMMLRQTADRTDGSARVIAVADVAHAQAERLAARWPGARALGSSRDIIEDPDIDAVWVCTPTALHSADCVAVARAGKHLFCEKPLAMTAAEASEMADAIRAAGVMSQVGLVLRYSPVYTVMRAMIGEPEAGMPLAAIMRDDQDFPIRGIHASGWRNDPSLTAGGTLVEHSVHDFDLMNWMFGEVRRVFCHTRNLRGARGVEDFGATDFEFESGMNAQLTSVWHRMIGRPSNRRLEVFCENLFVASDHDAAGTIIVQRGDGAREEVIPEGEVMRRFGEIIRRERPYLAAMKDYFAIPYALEDAAFVAALRGQCDVDPPFQAGVAAQRLVEAAYRSAQTRLPVEIKN
jgi:myo-inositol 2-dehydrogenase / D-chiro-inositol 1-dehydrogenase